jgi:hypothetical protein
MQGTKANKKNKKYYCATQHDHAGAGRYAKKPSPVEQTIAGGNWQNNVDDGTKRGERRGCKQ